ncbi:hypothetical protein BDN70DRAFT_996657 [Pholiota conissans]|uniref:F-box domain-containing protein n=1 Tax=Pholiota conissans TaxID=109636 RepID=A0A9P6CX03_9AGAR|nr:hypothetical protein BDN70DRAFT_996657 [Pholiota conissans]
MAEISSTMSSDFCYYCNNPDVGAERQCALADPEACAPCQRLSELDGRIEETKRMLVGLAKERQDVKERMNHVHDRVIHRLPLEIASRIFEWAMPWDEVDFDKFFAPTYMKSAPFVISSVSRQWRNMAHSTPRIWTNILLWDRGYDAFTLPSPSIVEDMISRACNFPLFIDFYARDSLQSDHAVALADILVRHSRNWVQLTYEGPFNLIPHFLPKDEDNLPLLRRLHLTNVNLTDFPVRSFDLRVVELEALLISGFKFTANRLNWKCLHELEINDISSLTDCYAALQNSYHLTRCILREPTMFLDYNPDELLVSRPPLFHPNLQYLEIAGHPLYGDILQYLDCPSLHTLVLGCHRPYSRRADIPLVVQFVNRSCRFLESLSIIRAQFLDSDIDMLCSDFYALRCLHLSIPAGSAEMAVKVLFTHLAEFVIIDGEKMPRYLPNLHSLTVTMNQPGPDFNHWHLLPDIFGISTHIVDGGTYSTERHRHTLKSISVSLHQPYDYFSPRDYPSKSEIYESFGRHALERIAWLDAEAGVKWTIRMGNPMYELEDVFRPALDWCRSSAAE